jgi:hypothetical protein
VTGSRYETITPVFGTEDVSVQSDISLTGTVGQIKLLAQTMI